MDLMSVKFRCFEQEGKRFHSVAGFLWMMGLIVAVHSSHGVIILPENVDWSRSGYADEIPVQENEPLPPPETPSPATPAEPLVTLRLHPYETTGNEFVLLGEVAEIESDDLELLEEIASIELFPAPEPGERVYVYPRRIEAALRHLGLTGSDFRIEGPDRVRVETPGQKVSVEQIEEAVNRALRRRNRAGSFGSVEAYLIRPPTIRHLPRGDLKIEVLDLDRPGSGIRNVQLAFWVDGRKVDTRTVAVRVTESVYGIVAARDLEPGEVVEESDLTEGLIPVAGPRSAQEYIDDANLIVGATVKRRVREGKPLREKDIEFEPILKQGAHVTLVQAVGSVRLTAPGILAEDLYRIGQVVKVRKLKSRKSIFGKAVSPRTIQVE